MMDYQIKICGSDGLCCFPFHVLLLQVEASMNQVAGNASTICPPSCSAVCWTWSSRFLFLLQGGAGELFLQPLTNITIAIASTGSVQWCICICLSMQTNILRNMIKKLLWKKHHLLLEIIMHQCFCRSFCSVVHSFYFSTCVLLADLRNKYLRDYVLLPFCSEIIAYPILLSRNKYLWIAFCYFYLICERFRI